MQAYETLRNAVSEGQFRFPNDRETVKDMLALQCDHQKQRVDHLPGQKKDDSDRLAAIAYHLTHQVNIWAMVDRVENAEFAAAMASPQIGGRATGIPYIRFGAVLRDRRGCKGWTQEQLATQSDLSVRYVQSIEVDEKLPSLETVFRLARAFNTSPAPLLDPLWREWREDQ